MIRILPVVLALLATPVLAQETVNLGSTSTREASWSYDAEIGAVEKSPSWDGKGQPPLSTAQAIAAANAWLQKNRPDIKVSQVVAVSITRVRQHPRLADRWTYRVDLVPVEDGKPRLGMPVSVVVLTSGMVVEPKKI